MERDVCNLDDYRGGNRGRVQGDRRQPAPAERASILMIRALAESLIAARVTTRADMTETMRATAARVLIAGGPGAEETAAVICRAFHIRM